MKILICSDGTPQGESATRLGGALAGPLRAATTLLGIAEKPEDEQPLREALEGEGQSLRAGGGSPQIVVKTGEPVRQIVDQTTTTKYELVVIGARHIASTGPYWRSEKTYEVIKSISPPVLVAIGEWGQLKRFLGHAAARNGGTASDLCRPRADGGRRRAIARIEIRARSQFAQAKTGS
ncbi:MAG: hypothetical protein DME34_10035 [Verrucomicrobia bacterium]|nr:MAG: hypothetical protein DME34_10035 [Verrucomicrobiota bacterium]